MENVSFISSLHTSTKRNYLKRVTEADKAECATVARQWGKDFWDGERKYGYGGYKYDGRWSIVAESMIVKYGLSDSSCILDVGCGKGHLLYELKKILPGAKVKGIDVSEYAIENSKSEVQDCLEIGDANKLSFEDDSFDFVFTINALHNLRIYDLKSAVKEIQRVSRNHSYIAVESYRNEREKVNLLYWQLTCQAFFSTEEWVWLYKEYGYTGDYEFIFFE
ncbi:MAG: class I SAM-dependent methyltransferase [Nitrospinae bacterium]|nr:class I SAM-dependent methyltransferase [Nitrospinota bacterium]